MTKNLTALLLILIFSTACQTAQQTPTQSSLRTSNRVTDAETEPDVAYRQTGKKFIPLSTLSEKLSKSSIDLKIHVLSANQADAMLIIGPAPEHRTMLVDFGEPMRPERDSEDEPIRNSTTLYPKLAKLLGTKSVHLDYVLISHFHQDHVGMPAKPCSNRNENTGLFALFAKGPSKFSVDTLLDPGDDDSDYIPKQGAIHCGVTSSYSAWKKSGALKQRDVPKIGTGSIDLGKGVTVYVAAVSGRAYSGDTGLMNQLAQKHPDLYSEDQPASENDRSIAFFLRLGEFEFFSAGDLTGSPQGEENKEYSVRKFGGEKSTVYTNVESYMVKRWKEDGNPESRVEVYRANHHGSGHSSNGDLARALKPAVVIYSAGPDNGYGHPSPDTVEEFCVGETRQYVTSGIDSESWPSGFPSKCGTVVEDDIAIYVTNGGSNYTVNGDPYASKTDAEEQGPISQMERSLDKPS